MYLPTSVYIYILFYAYMLPRWTKASTEPKYKRFFGVKHAYCRLACSQQNSGFRGVRFEDVKSVREFVLSNEVITYVDSPK